jgi:predicted DNA-binding transcriptional regulator AlpA
MTPNCTEKMWSVAAIASFLGVNVRTVWRRVADGELPKPVKVGRSVRWFDSEIAEYQKRLRSARDQKGGDRS